MRIKTEFGYELAEFGLHRYQVVSDLYRYQVVHIWNLSHTLNGNN